METIYRFGTRGENETLQVKARQHTDLNKWQTIVKEYPDQTITDRFYVSEKYDSAEDAEGNCYDWYIIKSHYRIQDKTPSVAAASDRLAAYVDYISMMADIELPEEDETEGGGAV
mgnify:CR=1 FL=1